MTIPCPISDALDICTGVNSHNVWLTIPPPGPFPVPTPLVSWEVPTIMEWIPGFSSHKLTTSVYHQGLIPIPKSIVQEGHNCGMVIPDITPPQPANQWYAICWPFSKREIKFSASSVKINGKAAGCTAGFRPIPMLSCGEPISLPGSNNLSNSLRSVYVGMSFWDFMLGAFQIVVSVGIDLIFNKIGGSRQGFDVSRGAAKQASSDLRDQALERAVQEGSSEAFQTTGQRAFNALAGKLGLTGQEALKNTVSDLSGFFIGLASGQDSGKIAHVGHSLFGAELHSGYDGWSLRGTGPLFGS